MAKQTINVGTNQDDGTGDLLRVAFQKINSNFTELYTEIGGDSLSNLNFSGSTISTDNTNSNLILDPNGTGLVQITGDLVVTGDATVQTDLAVTGDTALTGTLTVTGVTTLGTLVITSVSAGSGTYTGNLTVQGNTDLQGNVDIGDTTTDTITVTGRFDSSLVPSITETNDIGSSSLRWRDIYAQDGNFTGNIDVTGNVTIGGNITIGDAATDSITITADLTSDIIPNASSTYDIGAIGKTWQNVYADTIIGALTGNVTGNVTGDTAGTHTGAVVGNVTGDLTGNVTGNADTATTATNITATANDSTDETVYLTFVDGQSGVQGIETDVGLTYNPSSGILTTTSVAGNVTGDLTGNVTGNVTGDVTSSGTSSFSGTVNLTGSVTASQLTVDSITLNDNNITTNTTNADLVIIPAGTGVVRVDTSILPAAGGTYDLGSASLRWRDLYLSGSSLNLGGVALTNNSGTLEWNGSAVGGGSLSNIVEDTTPQLGGNLDVNGNEIIGVGNVVAADGGSFSFLTKSGATETNRFSISSSGVEVVGTLNTHTIPGGTGTLALTSDITFTASSTDTLTNKSGNISQWTNDSGYLTSALANVVEDTTPQLGGALDLNGNNITGTGDINITGAMTLSGNLTVNGTTTTVNSTEVTIQNAFVFEGATDDGFETTLTVVDPTADRTITLPDTSGTVALTSDITFTASSTDTLTNKSGNISQWTNDSGYLTSALANVVEDTTPQLGGNLDAQSFNITTLGTINTHTIPGGTGTLALTSDITGHGTLLTAGNTGTGSVNLSSSETLTVLGTTGQINVNAGGFALSFSLDSNIDSIQSIAFEGTTADANEITLTSADPSADRTVTLADLSGHVALFDVAPTATITATPAELNVLDGIPGTLTATELGYVDGVTSAIQTQIDGKASLSGATFTGDVIFNTGVEEAFDTLTSATGTVTHDCDNGHIFYHTTPSANWTANFTNLGLTAEYGTNLTVIVNQGATAFLPTAMQIGGVGQTINWQGGLSPTGTDNGIDVVSFTVLNDGGTYVVLGQMVDFG